MFLKEEIGKSQMSWRGVSRFWWVDVVKSGNSYTFE